MPNQKTTPGDPVSVVGGVDLPQHLIDAPAADSSFPSDDLGQQLYWLITMNPSLKLNFRDSDIQSMDDSTKRKLIAHVQFALGITPLKDAAV